MTVAYCRVELAETNWRFVRYATETGVENHARPRGKLWACRPCGFERLSLADAPDPEGIARAVLDEWMRGRGDGYCPAIGEPSQQGSWRLDYSDALLHLQAAVWESYLLWGGSGNFTGWCTLSMKRRLLDWWRSQHGRGIVKPQHAAASLDAPADDSDDGRSALGSSLSGGHLDVAEHSVAGLRRALLRRDSRPPDFAARPAGRSRPGPGSDG